MFISFTDWKLVFWGLKTCSYLTFRQKTCRTENISLFSHWRLNLWDWKLIGPKMCNSFMDWKLIFSNWNVYLTYGLKSLNWKCIFLFSDWKLALSGWKCVYYLQIENLLGWKSVFNFPTENSFFQTDNMHFTFGLNTCRTKSSFVRTEKVYFIFRLKMCWTEDVFKGLLSLLRTCLKYSYHIVTETHNL